MERVNNRLAENNPNLMFVTLIIAVLDLETGELNWTSAGHLPPCVISASGELRLLDGRGGPACGVQEGLPYAPLSTSLKPGDTLAGSTDGVTAAPHPRGQLSGEALLFARLAVRPPPSPAPTSRWLEE